VAFALTTLVAAPGPPPGIPRPVTGVPGEPVSVSGLRLTVLSAALDAPPPVTLGVSGRERLVVVPVLYQGGGVTSPYDWVLTDASGRTYGAVAEGIGGALSEQCLQSGGSARGRFGFVVPRNTRGLVLHFEAEEGFDSVRVPLG
jgi:hypothetical protein